MKRWCSLPVIVALMTAFVSGCARISEPVPPPTAPGCSLQDYFRDRGYDFLDLFRLQWGAPRDFHAFGAKVKATSLAEIGFVYFEGKKAGMERRAIGVLRQQKIEGGITPVYFTNVRETGQFGNEFMRTDTEWAKLRDRRIIRNGCFWSDGTLHPWSFGFELELLCFGGPDVQFYFCELGDFLLGIFCLDPRNDDLARLKTGQEDNQFFDAKPKKE